MKREIIRIDKGGILGILDVRYFGKRHKYFSKIHKLLYMRMFIHSSYFCGFEDVLLQNVSTLGAHQ